MLISFVHSLGEGTRPTRGHTKSASISAGHRSSSGVPPSDHSLLDPQPRNAHNSLLATADPLRQRYRSPMPYQPTYIHSSARRPKSLTCNLSSHPLLSPGKSRLRRSQSSLNIIGTYLYRAPPRRCFRRVPTINSRA